MKHYQIIVGTMIGLLLPISASASTEANNLAQITNVDQLRDVAPID